MLSWVDHSFNCCYYTYKLLKPVWTVCSSPTAARLSFPRVRTQRMPPSSLQTHAWPVGSSPLGQGAGHTLSFR